LVITPGGHMAEHNFHETRWSRYNALLGNKIRVGTAGVCSNSRTPL
jgi:hypothetical protein